VWSLHLEDGDRKDSETSAPQLAFTQCHHPERESTLSFCVIWKVKWWSRRYDGSINYFGCKTCTATMSLSRTLLHELLIILTLPKLGMSTRSQNMFAGPPYHKM
jgi:hypothetical protein